MRARVKKTSAPVRKRQPKRKAMPTTVDEFFKVEVADRPRQGERGVESDWLLWTHWTQEDDPVCVVDTSMWGSPEERVTIRLPKGEYRVEVKVISFGWDQRFSRLRMFSTGDPVKLGKQLDKVPIDAGSLCFFHSKTGALLMKPKVRDRLKKMWQSPADRKYAFHSRISRNAGPLGMLSTGFGDGRYPVKQLKKGAAVVGFEIVFLRSDSEYPFEVPNVSEAQIEDEKLHWAQIEHLWDPAWAAFKESPEATERFFAGLTPGQRALLALDVFTKISLNFGIRNFLSTPAARVVSEEVFRGYTTLEAVDYAQRFEPVLQVIPVIGTGLSIQEKYRIIEEVQRENCELLSSFQDWFATKMKDEDSRIEKFIRAYVETHPADFIK
jgi:hypothetical protein